MVEIYRMDQYLKAKQLIGTTLFWSPKDKYSSLDKSIVSKQNYREEKRIRSRALIRCAPWTHV